MFKLSITNEDREKIDPCCRCEDLRHSHHPVRLVVGMTNFFKPFYNFEFSQSLVFFLSKAAKSGIKSVANQEIQFLLQE